MTLTCYRGKQWGVLSSSACVFSRVIVNDFLSGFISFLKLWQHCGCWSHKENITVSKKSTFSGVRVKEREKTFFWIACHPFPYGLGWWWLHRWSDLLAGSQCQAVQWNRGCILSRCPDAIKSEHMTMCQRDTEWDNGKNIVQKYCVFVVFFSFGMHERCIDRAE